MRGNNSNVHKRKTLTKMVVSKFKIPEGNKLFWCL